MKKGIKTFKKWAVDNGVSVIVEKGKTVAVNGCHAVLNFYDKPLPEGIQFANERDVDLTSYNFPLPDGIQFNNGGDVYLTSYNFPLPENIQFNNGGHINLSSYNLPLPDGIQFNNGGSVDLRSYNKPLPQNIKFHNGSHVNLNSYNKPLPSGIQFSNGDSVGLRAYNKPLPENIQFNNGGDVFLNSYNHPLPENIQFNNGGSVYLSSETKQIRTPYIKRFKLQETEGKTILYKRVSADYKTQEGTPNETLWMIGSTVEHPSWNPTKDECGAGKFHACAKPFWCDAFRSKKTDKYISILVAKEDLFEWTESPSYPQKIGFRKGTSISEVERVSF